MLDVIGTTLMSFSMAQSFGVHIQTKQTATDLAEVFRTSEIQVIHHPAHCGAEGNAIFFVAATYLRLYEVEPGKSNYDLKKK